VNEQNFEVRLWDSQWVSIIGSANADRDMDKGDAIELAIRLTEEAIAKNVRDMYLPPFRKPIEATDSAQAGLKVGP
jgi:hypothetical protein